MTGRGRSEDREVNHAPAGPRSVAAPEPARRPKNRRELILTGAARLFRERGYHAVGIDEIGEAVGVTGTTLYRHFDSKEGLLAAALRRAIDEFLASIESLRAPGGSADEVREFLTAWTAAAIDNWDYFAILPRDANALSPDRLRQHYAALEPLDLLVRQIISRAQPGLDATQLHLRWLATIGAINGVLRYGHWANRHDHQPFLVELGVALFAVEPAPPLIERVPHLAIPGGQQRASTRERLLAFAVDQFAKDRFATLGIADLGRGVGISGPGVYRHFTDKQAILREAIERFDGALVTMLAGVLALEVPPERALDDLARSLVDLTFRCPDHAIVYFTKQYMLADVQERSPVARNPLLFDEWVHLLRRARPELTKWAARTYVYGLTGALITATADLTLRQYDCRDALVLMFDSVQRRLTQPL